MAQFTIYRSSDGSAPTLSGTAGDLINLLTKCLVTGYGAKAAAGWSKPFTGTNKAVFKLGAGTGLYLRVDDNAPVTAKEARVTGYVSMSDVDTGTGPFPTAAQGGGVARVVARKSSTADATARDWIVVADSRTAYVFVLSEDNTGMYVAFGFGDFYSFKSDDAYNCMIIGRDGDDSASLNNNLFPKLETSLAGAPGGHFMARGHTQLGGSVNFGKHGDLTKAGILENFVGVIPMTNPEDGGIYLSSCWIHDPFTIPVNGCRGRMRGLWIPLHAAGSFTDGDTFSGGASGELIGKTFIVIAIVRYGIGGQNGMVVIETSNTLESN